MRILKSIIFIMALVASTVARAQDISSVHGTVSDDMGPLMGATVCEIDGTGRIITSATTDLNEESVFADSAYAAGFLTIFITVF